MPFAALLIGGLLTMAALSYIFHDWQRETAIVCAAILAGLGASLWWVDLDAVSQLGDAASANGLTLPFERAGFTLQLSSSVAPTLVLALLIGALVLLSSAVLPQARNFVPLTMTLLAGYSALLLLVAAPLAPPLMLPLFLSILGVIAVFLLQADRNTIATGPLRMLIPPLLATPIAFIVSWYLEQAPLNPQTDLTTQIATPLIALMFVLLVAPVPLHSAQPITAQNSPPIASALVTLLYQLALVHWLQQITDSFPMIRQEGTLNQLLVLTGLLTAVWGGLAAAGANNLGRLWGYSALHDWGLILLVAAAPGLKSWSLMIFLFGLRTVSMLTTAIGLATLEQNGGSTDARNLQGAGSRLPWSSAAFLLGGLGLVGFPLSAGFTGHWSALLLIAEADWRISAAILIASAGAIIGYITVARRLFGPLENRSMFRESILNALLAAFVLIVSISLAIAPQLLDGPVSRAVAVLGS